MASNENRIRELSYREASYEFDISAIKENWPLPETILGQPRALRSLELGLGIDHFGYNIFISGDDGTGRMTAVKKLVRKYSDDISSLKDIGYVHNFSDPDSPQVLVLDRGLGRRFKQDLDSFCTEISSVWKAHGNDIAERASELLDRISDRYESVAVRSYINRAKDDFRKQSYQIEDVTFERYRFNLLLDSSLTSRRPLVIESHPSFHNIFGTISSEKGKLPYQRIHAGSMIKASGGFFVLNAEEMMMEKGLWDSIKRYIESGKIFEENISEIVAGEVTLDGIRPQMVPMQPKVIMIGSEDTYDMLCDKDADFLRLFKISAQFDYSMEATDENINGLCAYIRDYCRKNRLLDISREGLAQLLRYSSWFCENRGQLTTQIGQLCDLCFEADFFARRQNRKEIDADCIERANDERDFISSMLESKINEDITKGDMIISLSGSKVGVVNGLAVMDRGSFEFGTPTVISVAVAPGSEGIVNIEHEAGLSGEIHDKGLLILQGYLRKHYAKTFPLSIYAGICFEQNYSEVDGDSASSSELYALLSAIAEVPVRQDIAVTGSVNQMGTLQPVGGINEKIEGFFKACQKRGLTGKQGVIIPIQNIRNLILPKSVLDAINDGMFHIYPVSTIDEGMHILTGRITGERNSKGQFPPDSVNRDIEERLKRLYRETISQKV